MSVASIAKRALQVSIGMGLVSSLRKYSVTIVMVPAIFGCHYGWLRLQEVDSLVTPAERKELPIFIMAKKFITAVREPKEEK